VFDWGGEGRWVSLMKTFDITDLTIKKFKRVPVALYGDFPLAPPKFGGIRAVSPLWPGFRYSEFPYRQL